MRKSLFLVGVIGLALCANAAGQSLKASIEAGNKQIEKALLSKDIAKFEKVVRPMMTKDFVHVENGQSMNFDKMVETMKQGYGMLDKITKVKASATQIKESGKTGSCIMAHEMTGTVKGGDKKTHVLAFVGHTKNSFRKEGGKWLMSRMEWVDQKMTMDGKPFNPAPPPTDQ